MSEIENCFIYLIAHKGSNGPCAPVKIGITAFPDRRLATLQTGNPTTLEMVFKFSAPSSALARHAEGLFHSIAKDARLSGEWFDLSPLDALATLIKLIGAIICHDVADPDSARMMMEWAGIFSAAEFLTSLHGDAR